MRYKPYPKYKGSGVEWIGKVPEHWGVVPLKFIVATPITDGPHETPKLYDDGIPFVSAEACSSGSIDFDKIRGRISLEDHKSYSRKYKPQRNDIFMIKSGATTGITAIVETDRDFNIWSPLAAIRIEEQYNSLYVLNCMRSQFFLDSVALNWNYGTQQNIGMGTIENLPITWPPTLREQTAIADFLERETARIDALVEKKETQIRLLQEKRQALISHVVTKGLDPAVPMKDSGVEWLGLVPKHWYVSKLRQKCNVITDGAHISPDTIKEDYPFVSTVDVNNGMIDLVGCLKTSADSYDYMVRTGCQPKKGDVLFSKDGTVGRTAVVDFEEHFVVASSLVIITPAPQYLLSNFLDYWLNGQIIKQEVALQLSGSALKRISIEKIGNLPALVPPVEEQRDITLSLQREINRIDYIIYKIRTSVGLLKERRSALITAAVTGQIDVREMA